MSTWGWGTNILKITLCRSFYIFGSKSCLLSFCFLIGFSHFFEKFKNVICNPELKKVLFLTPHFFFSFIEFRHKLRMRYSRFCNNGAVPDQILTAPFGVQVQFTRRARSASLMGWDGRVIKNVFQFSSYLVDI